MKLFRQRAFTLIELIMGMVLMLVIMSVIVTTLKSGLDIYTKAEAKSLVTNGVRFTVDSYSRRISTLLENATEIEILDDNTSIPASAGTDEHYIYLSDKTVMHKDVSDDIELEGSDYINSLTFTIPTSSADLSSNYILTMSIGGLNDKYPTAKLDITVNSALYNKPDKSGESVIGSNYSGKVLRFISPPRPLNIILKDLKILSENESGTDLSNNSNVLKGTKLYASYIVEPDEDPGFALKDCSDIQWYISGSSSPDVLPEAAEAGLPEPSSANQQYYCWLLVDASNNPITERTLSTNGMFYVRTSASGGSTKSTQWGEYGIIRFYVKAKMQRVNGSSIFNGPSKQSPFVAITKTDRGGKLWKKWMKSLQEIMEGGEGEEGFFSTSALAESELHIDKEEGETYLTIKRGQGSSGAVTVAVAGGELLADEKIESLKTDGDKSYTTVTNYSLIVDAEVPAGNGYAVLLNGSSVLETSSGFKDCGYMLQYDKAIDAFPMRLFVDGTQYGYDDFYGMEREYTHNSDYSSNKLSGGSDSYPGPHYGPGYLKNSIFKYTSSKYESSRCGNNYPWNERRRILITVLEYYLSTSGPENPCYIVRLRLLKNYTDINTNDPWQTGKDFFLSEPAWYGGFVGDEYQHTYQIKNPYQYGDWNWHDATENEYNRTRPNRRQVVKRFTVRNFSAYSGNNITLSSSSISDKNAKSRYITKVPWGSSDGSGETNEAVFKAKEMNVRDDITSAARNMSVSRNIDTVFEYPDRNRYIGLRTWTDNTSQVKFYSVNYAPGFTKAELQAILPAKAKMYEIGDGYNGNGTGEANVYGVDQTHLNMGLFGSNNGYSDGEGNGNNKGYRGVMGIQHLRNDCDCPICSKYAEYNY